jgi:hypothetical protein
MDDDRERNVSHLPSFFISGLCDVELPNELINEPYSYIDTGERPDIIVSRLPFLFNISKDRVASVHNGSERRIECSSSLASRYYVTPIKRKSNVSVITVYDTYGIEMVYTYIKHLYHHKYYSDHPSWLELYLRGSLAVIKPELFKVDSVDSVFDLCHSLMKELVDYDSKQPKMLGQLHPITLNLSVDLLAKITRHARLCKEVREEVLMMRCNSMNMEQELIVANFEDKQPITQLTSRGEYVLAYQLFYHKQKKWCLTTEQGTFILSHISLRHDEDMVEATTVVAHSLRVYDVVYKSKCLNPNRLIVKMLQELGSRLSIVTEQNLGEVCAWIVQLSHDTREKRTKRRTTCISRSSRVAHFRDTRELSDELQRLIAIAIGLYMRTCMT